MIQVGIKKLHPDAVIPKRAHPDDAGFDLYAVNYEWDAKESLCVYSIGLAFEIPYGYVGLIFPRSSVCGKDMDMANCVGVIDAGYRGEVTVKFRQTGRPLLNKYYPGERVAQMIIMKRPEVEFVEKEELSETSRGTGGYGSTGL